MPGLDGYEVCRRLKANPATNPIPVIVVTAVEDDALNRLGLRGGSHGVPREAPFRPEALLSMIRAAIGGADRRAKTKAKREGNPP